LTEDMPRKRPPYIRHERTRHGKMIWTFRRKGEYRQLPDEYGTPEFWEAYNAALVGRKPQKPASASKGTIAWLVAQYKQSPAFASYADSTRRVRDNILAALVRESGSVLFSKVERRHMQAALDKKFKTPNAANNALIVISQMFKWAVKAEHIAENPCDGVSLIDVDSDGFHAWTIEEVDQYRAAHPIGTMPRLAIDMLLFLGLRRSDVIVAGRQHVKDGVLSIKTKKTGTWVYLTICTELAGSINATKTGEMAFLTSATGRPFASAQSFGNWFKTQCRVAGLPSRCAAHGVRKTGATIAAENGATAHELMAMYGWSRLEMAELYTKEADKRRLAKGASERIANNASSYLKQGTALGVKKDADSAS